MTLGARGKIVGLFSKWSDRGDRPGWSMECASVCPGVTRSLTQMSTLGNFHPCESYKRFEGQIGTHVALINCQKGP